MKINEFDSEFCNCCDNNEVCDFLEEGLETLGESIGVLKISKFGFWETKFDDLEFVETLLLEFQFCLFEFVFVLEFTSTCCCSCSCCKDAAINDEEYDALRDIFLLGIFIP